MTSIAREIGPRIFMGFITVSAGLVMVGMGLVNNWKEIAALRVILSLFEAGLFPAAVFSSAADMSSKVDWMVYGLEQMEQLQGHNGWRWNFIIEGVSAVAVGQMGFVLIVDFPEDGRPHDGS
ncbi:hypothetical protein BDW59DRAFT_167092 [Aspergillus cavernicola]|uniref:Major facilitator superfamily domain-containing protein n=1 Tax=Aspergillus cavernicola TaxID=176166 RepID=A0ABR4HGZ5_9EURO